MAAAQARAPPRPGPRLFVIGVGMTEFVRPGSRDWDYPDMAQLAIRRAFADVCVCESVHTRTPLMEGGGGGSGGVVGAPRAFGGDRVADVEGIRGSGEGVREREGVRDLSSAADRDSVSDTGVRDRTQAAAGDTCPHAVTYADIDAAAVGYVYGDSTCGQRALYSVGMTGIPVVNVNNNCATGSSALACVCDWLRAHAGPRTSAAALALGFEKMERGSLGSKYDDRTNPLDRHVQSMIDAGFDIAAAPMAPQMFGNAAREHMREHGSLERHYALIAEKNHKHSQFNPYAQFRELYDMDAVLRSPRVHGPLTKLQCCPTSDGAACVIVCTEAFVDEHALWSTAIEIVGQAMASDTPRTLTGKSAMAMVGVDVSRLAAKKALAQAGAAISQVGVIELHDCFSANELLTYEALGLCAPGKAGEAVDHGLGRYGSDVVINPSGGLISKGHPLGATGLAQIAELTWQLRREAGRRQVRTRTRPLALAHNLGLGGAAVVTVLARPKEAATWKARQLPRHVRICGSEGYDAIPDASALGLVYTPALASATTDAHTLSRIAEERARVEMERWMHPRL